MTLRPLTNNTAPPPKKNKTTRHFKSCQPIRKQIFFDQPQFFLHETPFSQASGFQASPFLGLDDALVQQIASASLDDAVILAGGAEGRSEWRDQRQARWVGPTLGRGHILVSLWSQSGVHQVELGSLPMIYRVFMYDDVGDVSSTVGVYPRVLCGLDTS